jgi:hypothetical protein
MKKSLLILGIILSALIVIGRTKSEPYDWQAHEKRIDALFEKQIPQILKGEREKIETLVSKAKADQYMSRFEEGLRSNAGIIMIEGAGNRWLEIAYREGYNQKSLFRSGYFSGLSREAEKDK